MKKGVVVVVCSLLTGCMAQVHTITGPSEGTLYFYQDTAPHPWISVLPSKRAAAFKAVDFAAIAHQIRFDMTYYPHEEKFKDVNLVLVDYDLLLPEKLGKTGMEVCSDEVSFSENYAGAPARYVMTIKFYSCKRKPPFCPIFEETIYLEAFKAPPQEAMRLMALMIMEDRHASPLSRIISKLDN